MKQSFLIFVMLFSAAACSQRPVVTFEVMTPRPDASATLWMAGTQTALVASTPTPWVAGTQTALAVTIPPTIVENPALPTFPFPSAIPIAAIVENSATFSPVLYGGKFYGTTSFIVLGGVSTNDWFPPNARSVGEATYSLHTLEQEYKYFIWGEVPEFSPICQSYSVGTEANLDEVGFVGVLDGWKVSKRDVTELSDDGDVYQQAVLDWLKAEGVTKPELGDLHIYRVDLEGDGSDEIFISATHLDESQHTTKAGDYSIILMRKVQGNDVVIKLVVGDVYDSQDLEITYPRTYSLANFIDLNQDGVLEVVVDIQKWEGFGATVYEVEDQTVTQVLQGGCGL